MFQGFRMKCLLCTLCLWMSGYWTRCQNVKTTCPVVFGDFRPRLFGLWVHKHMHDLTLNNAQTDFSQLIWVFTTRRVGRMHPHVLRYTPGHNADHFHDGECHWDGVIADNLSNQCCYIIYESQVLRHVYSKDLCLWGNHTTALFFPF